MGYARKSLVCLNDTPYYHVVARCVRRAWLWGFDEYAGKDYFHRKAWVIERLQTLSGVFAIDLCAYAVMSNHYHLVLRVDAARAAAWTPEQIVDRWAILFRLPEFVQRWRAGEADGAEQEAARAQIERWRARLTDISWYMRCLNEHLARRANAEDRCTGRFWEGRFRSQALLDEAGLLTAMAYVDLNPVRAGTAATPEASEFTSIYARIQALCAAAPAPATSGERVPRLTSLLDFHEPGTAPELRLPFRFVDYLQLLDWTGRVVRPVNAAQHSDFAHVAADRADPGLRGHLFRSRQLARPHGTQLGRNDGLRGRRDHRLARRLSREALGRDLCVRRIPRSGRR